MKHAPSKEIRILVKETYQRVIDPYVKATQESEKQYVRSIEMIDRRIRERRPAVSKEFETARTKVDWSTAEARMPRH